MGMYDIVSFTCPRCDSKIEEQTKAGDCILADIDADEVPIVIAKSIEGNLVRCEKCDGLWTIVIKPTQSTVTMGLA